MGNGEHASAFNLSKIWDRLKGPDCNDKGPQAWPNFSTELEVIQMFQMCFPDFKISYIPRTQNEVADSVTRNARSFYRSLCFRIAVKKTYLH